MLFAHLCIPLSRQGILTNVYPLLSLGTEVYLQIDVVIDWETTVYAREDRSAELTDRGIAEGYQIQARPPCYYESTTTVIGNGW